MMPPPVKSIPLLVLAVSLLGVVDAFYFPLSPRSVQISSTTHLCSSNDPSKGKNGKTKFGQRTANEASRFLADFRTANGEIIDPYRSLRVPRSATLDDIKSSYRKLSRKLHPDAVSKSRILPGNCSNLDDVREEWEKVKFSYEILSDQKARKCYDRNSSVAEVLKDPTAAAGRAVVGGAFAAVGMGFGAMWKVGELAVKAVAQPSSPPVRKETTNNVHQTEVVGSETPTSSENNAGNTKQARVWTVEEMRAAASTAATVGVSPNALTETILITFDSNNAITPIRKEEPSLPNSDTAVDIKADESIIMITPEPIKSATKTKTNKPKRSKLKSGGTGFSKK